MDKDRPYKYGGIRQPIAKPNSIKFNECKVGDFIKKNKLI